MGAIRPEAAPKVRAFATRTVDHLTGWGNSELHYALALQRAAARRVPGFEPHVIIDTSRNGNPLARSGTCTSWCNVRDAALGAPPSAATALPDTVDAYYWIKVRARRVL